MATWGRVSLSLIGGDQCSIWLDYLKCLTDALSIATSVDWYCSLPVFLSVFRAISEIFKVEIYVSREFLPPDQSQIQIPVMLL